MLDFLKWHTLKQDQHAGSLVYAGGEKTFRPRVELTAYDDNDMMERELDPGGPARPSCVGMRHLVRVVGVHDPEVVRRVGEWYGAHPLLLEDAMNLGQRPTLTFPDEGGAFVVLKDVAYDKATGRLDQEQISLLLTEQTVVAFQENDDAPFAGFLSRLRASRGRARSAGATYLFITLIDAVIDRHFAAVAALNERAEAIENALEERQSEQAVHSLYRLMREVVQLRSILLPTRDVLTELARSEDLEISEGTVPYLDKVCEHAAQVADAAVALHEILSSMLDAQVSISGMRMNRIMKLLTLISTIFIPLTFLAGIYGMNFRYMPELDWKYGYFALLGIMAALVLVMLALFRRRDWL
ncbi:MAG: magnesium/cobalt transporter CorA [Desulfovibrionaceae bacterium]